MKSTEAQNLYAGRASFYERLFVRFLGWSRELERFFQKSDTMQRNSKILDAGCGTGVITRVLYELARKRDYGGITFHAFDLTQEMLDVFHQWAVERGADDIDMRQADVLKMETLPQGWKDYDLIISSTMLEYLPGHKVKEALINLRNLLGTGGRLLVFVTKRNLMTRWLARKWWKTNIYAESEIESLFRDAGFHTIKFGKLSPGWSSSIMVIEAER